MQTRERCLYHVHYRHERWWSAMTGMTAKTAAKAMSGAAVLLKECISGGKPTFWLNDAKGRCVRVPYAVGKELSESPLVAACEPGLFEGYAQSWVIKQVQR
jgi:hypothetical protein